MTTDTCLIADLHRDMQQRATEQQERILHALLAENFREYRPAIEIRLPRIVPPCVQIGRAHV